MLNYPAGIDGKGIELRNTAYFRCKLIGFARDYDAFFVHRFDVEFCGGCRSNAAGVDRCCGPGDQQHQISRVCRRDGSTRHLSPASCPGAKSKH